LCHNWIHLWKPSTVLSQCVSPLRQHGNLRPRLLVSSSSFSWRQNLAIFLFDDSVELPLEVFDCLLSVRYRPHFLPCFCRSAINASSHFTLFVSC
jgi:hypothetical protein